MHRAEIDSDGARKAVAVKILRPGVERRFKVDLDAFFFVARKAESLSLEAQRLRPVEAVATLARSVAMEMDFRLEAAALSEMAENTREDADFRVPVVDWDRTAREVLTLEWIDGTPLNDRAALEAKGLDLPALGRKVIQSFLRHALRDGFFHADMHPGNLFVDAEGRLVAVDFGIMGRLGPKERRFLAEILFGFITRDYQRTAQIHFDAGYVPRHHSVEAFAQAIRAIGEPIHNRTAEDISMAKLLMLLFEVTGLFDMRTRPELLLLQKTMVVVEGVARTLDPKLDMWKTAEPVVREWIERNLGPDRQAGRRGRGRRRDRPFPRPGAGAAQPRRHAARPDRRHHPQRPGAVAGDGGSHRPRRAAPQPLDRGRAVGDRGAAGRGWRGCCVMSRSASVRHQLFQLVDALRPARFHAGQHLRRDRHQADHVRSHRQRGLAVMFAQA